MDAFAVTVGEGLSCPVGGMKNTVRRALYFGFFQALMPLAGFYLAGTVSGRLMSIGPYISFFMLAFVGIKMVVDAVRGREDGQATGRGEFSPAKTLVLALATSIDALAVGVGLAFTETSVWLPCGIIGATTFVICILGGTLCTKFPKVSGKGAGIAGGLVLIGIGVKLLVEGVILK
jgi:putative Mn2+ efflux pump MntP